MWTREKLIILSTGIAMFMVAASYSFYWFQWRPSEIKKECHSISIEAAIKKQGGNDRMFNKDDYDFYYKQCLRSKGL